MTQMKKVISVLCVSIAFVGCTKQSETPETAPAPEQTMEAPAEMSAYDQCMQNATTDEAKSACASMNAEGAEQAPAEQPTEMPAEGTDAQ